MQLFIWGTGKIARRYLDTGEIKKDEIIGFIETKRTKDCFEGKKIYEPNEVKNVNYDYIIVCVSNACKSIHDMIRQCGLASDKMIYVNNWSWIDGTSFEAYPENICKKIHAGQDAQKIEELFPQLYHDFIEEYDQAASRYVATMRNGYDLVEKDDLLQTEKFNPNKYMRDYVRYRSFELMANEILSNGVTGAVAELGVFRGDFARLINGKFKDRKMYLFDTFDSFDEDEFNAEVAAGRCEENFINVFKNISVKSVLDNMIYPENIEVHEGFFPATLIEMGGEETYCFVSIDVDFEKSILEGLRYFYPKVNHGGAIFIHDYNNRFLEGVKAAVRTYEEENHIMLAKVPLCDEGGTLVICK